MRGCSRLLAPKSETDAATPHRQRHRKEQNEHTGYSTGHRALCRKILWHAAPGHFRDAHRLKISSLGIGTYLGQPDDKVGRQLRCFGGGVRRERHQM